MKPTITYTGNNIYTNTPVGVAGDNGAGQDININVSSKIQTSTIDDRPWMAYYLTSDDFFDILKVAFEDTYGSDHRWHPEDLYVNVSCVLEVVSNTLAGMVHIKAGRELRGVKGQ